MEMVILGSGTSHGIPVIGCDCPVCSSMDPYDNRMRASALLRFDDGKAILIDAGPEFRIQALRAHITHLDALLVTHSHADHIHGLDDLRIFTMHANIPVYGNKQTIKDITNRFDYVFTPTMEGGGKPQLELITVNTDAGQAREIMVAGKKIIPIPLYHGSLPILGWRCGDTAYLTDCNEIPETSYELLEGCTNLVIDALRFRPHSTHFSFDEALAQIDRIKPENAFFTHLCHDFSHNGIKNWLRQNAPGKKIEPAYDGLRITIR